MTVRKVHLANDESQGLAECCMRRDVELTNDPSSVNCRKCLRCMRRRGMEVRKDLAEWAPGRKKAVLPDGE